MCWCRNYVFVICIWTLVRACSDCTAFLLSSNGVTNKPIHSSAKFSEHRLPPWIFPSFGTKQQDGTNQHQNTAICSSTNAADDLTSALALLDRKWQIQQQSSGKRSRWSKLTLSSEENVSQDKNTENEPAYVVLDLRRLEEFVYLLEPPNNSIPSCLIVFSGGAGLGTYPQTAYNELLLRISNRLNAAVITAPYEVGLDHFSIAKETGDKCRRAIIQCQDDPSRLYPESVPVYSLSHSLGAKLSAIYIAATYQDFQGIGMISYNNFGFGQTISMAREFARTIQTSQGRKPPKQDDSYKTGASEDVLNGIFNFAEMAVSAIGIQFSPSPLQMERLLAMKFTKEIQSKTRLFTFDDDMLENTQQFINSCSGSDTVAVSGLPGTHLTPVYFKLGFDEIFTTASADIPEDAKVMAKEAMGGFESASFGNEDELDNLVDEVCSWIKGLDPTRQPSWLRERPKLAGTAD